MTGQPGQAPGIVRIRLSGSPEDCAAVADELAPWTLDRSAPYPTRRDPGVRVYLTIAAGKASGRREIGGTR